MDRNPATDVARATEGYGPGPAPMSPEEGARSHPHNLPVPPHRKEAPRPASE